jgi:hypothetical protein
LRDDSSFAPPELKIRSRDIGSFGCRWPQT